MKKQYINPETTVVLLNTQGQLMAGSTITETLKTTEVGDNMDFRQSSRRFDLWDDDEE